MTLDEVLSRMDLQDSREILQPYWEESAACRPALAPSFLDPSEFTAHRALVGLSAEVDPLLEATAQQVRENPALRNLAWHCSRLLYEHPEYPGPSISRWPSLEQPLGERSGGFYLLIALALVPRVQAVHRTRDIPETITLDTCASPFEELIGLYRETHGGAWGAMLQVLYWLRHYAAGELLRLGRFEYMVQPFHGQIQAFRHRESKQVVALAAEGMWFDRYFPERPFVGFTCGSWILNPDLAELYSPTSNMVLWQRELYLFPWPSNGKAGLFFLFGEEDVDLATAPRDTSIRRAVLDHLSAGHPLRNGGMFLLTEDFPHFGTQHYRNHWPPEGWERDDLSGDRA